MKASSARSLIGKIAGLSIGTIFARILATLGQLLLVIWISPVEFGYWAAATSAISLVAGFTNFGQVNAYLSGGPASYSRVRKTTLNYNLVLTIVGTGIASLYLFSDRPYIALLAFIAAATIPFTGLGDLSYAVGVKHQAYRTVVVVQLLAAIAKIIVGISIAFFFQSAVALAISIIVFSAAMHFGLRRVVKLNELRDSGYDVRPKAPTQIMWAANSIATTLPLQVGFLVMQFLANAELLGLFYMSFQVTVGISGLVAAPLAKVSLSTLGGLQGRLRITTAMNLSAYFAHGMLIVSALVIFASPIMINYVPMEWRRAVPAVAVLMSSMPVRMMGPVVDSFQQATNRWWQSTGFNVADAVGTAGAAVLALTGDLMVVGTALTLWKIALASYRAFFVYRAAGIWWNLKLTCPILAGSTLLCLVPFVGQLYVPLLLFVIFMAVIFILGGRRFLRVTSEP